MNGALEAIGRQGVRGWLGGAVEPGQPLRLSVCLAGHELARIATTLARADVVAAGLSDDAHCGFEYLFARPLEEAEVADVQVLRLADGVPLPVQPGAPALALYSRLFDGSYARDNHVPEGAFLSMHYLRHNARRLEHLAGLGLPLHGRSVVEFGAGVGDHTAFYLDRDCAVTATDARPGSPTGELPGWRNGFPPPGPRIDRGIWDQSGPYRASSPASLPGKVAGSIDLDAATAQEIESLPAIGPALAGRIVANRDSFGSFGSLDALGRVKGLGPATRRRLASRVTFSGQARR